MKLSVATGLVALGMTLVVLATFFIDVPPGDAATAYPCCGQAHGEVDEMRIAGSGAARGAHIWGLSVLFGALILALFVLCMLIGIRRKGRIGPAGKLIAAGTVVYFLAYAGMMLAYRTYMTADSLSTFGTLPTPTAWMLYALWPAPFLFLCIFVFGFRRFIWDDESEREFQQVVADKRASENEA